jgi:putative hydrolase
MVISKDQRQFKMLIDLHIHTIHSGHAYASFYEILNKAKSKGMKIVGITDHGPDTLGGANNIHFKMGYRAPKNYKGIEVLWGGEANIIDREGNIDIDEYSIKNMDFLMLGVHKNQSYKDSGKKENTRSLIRCFKKNPILVFTHPSVPELEYDHEEVWKAAFEEGILLELNTSTLIAKELGHEKENLENVKKMIRFVKDNNKKLIVNSDAHFLEEMDNEEILKKYWKELGLTKEMIINNYPEELKKLIASKKSR